MIGTAAPAGMESQWHSALDAVLQPVVLSLSLSLAYKLCMVGLAVSVLILLSIPNYYSGPRPYPITYVPDILLNFSYQSPDSALCINNPREIDIIILPSFLDRHSSVLVIQNTTAFLRFSTRCVFSLV